MKLTQVINTPLQRGVGGRRRVFNRFNGFLQWRKTVETVHPFAASSNTPLKRGVNEASCWQPRRWREICVVFPLLFCASTWLSSAAAPTSEAKPKPPAAQEPSEQERIEQAIPRKALVAPLKPRKLLIFGLNVNYGGHASIATANQAFTRMGEETGAFQAVVSKDPEVFEPESLKQFDAVFFNNTVGNLFEDPKLRRALVEFVYSGGGLLGVHGTTVAFTRWPGAEEDWPEFGIMLGARGANHRDSDERIAIKLDDPTHPLNQAFKAPGFEYRDEFFRFQDVYSRNHVRVLLSIDMEKTDANLGAPRGNCVRADNDYALAWVRNYGRGRVFYCTIAHNPRVFWDPRMLRFYLGAIQFALGDLPASTIPSGRLTHAIRVQEKLGWRLGLEAASTGQGTLFDAIDRASELGLPYLGAVSSQRVSKELAKPFDAQLSGSELKQIRLKLDSAGVRLLTYQVPTLPGDEPSCRQAFEFGRKIGIDAFVAAPAPESLDTIEVLAKEYGIQVALSGREDSGAPASPQALLNLCRGRSKLLGVCADLNAWTRSGTSPLEIIKSLGDRIITLRAWRTSSGSTGQLLRELKRLSIQPAMIGLGYSGSGFDSAPDLARGVEFFNERILELEK